MANHAAALLSPKTTRKSTGLPRLSKDLRQGIQALEDFGFRTEGTLPTSPRLSLLLGNFSDKPARPLIHVTDFWSSRQQKEFLAKTGLRRAQFEREKQERKEAFLQSKEKIEGGRVMDQLYERILVEDDPVEAGKLYASGPQGRLRKQLRNQLVCNTQRAHRPLILKSSSEPTVWGLRKKPAVLLFDELVSRCDDTIKRTTVTRQ